MPIRNTYVKKWAHHEINKAVNKLKRGHSLPKQLSKDRLKTFDHVYHRSEIRLASNKNDEKSENMNTNLNSNSNSDMNRPRGEYLHEQIENDKVNGLQALDGGRDCCCWHHCEYTVIPGSFRNVLVQCSNGCYMRYHNDHSESCWHLCRKSYQKMNSNSELIDYQQKCIKKNCKGRIVSIVHCIGFSENETVVTVSKKREATTAVVTVAVTAEETAEAAEAAEQEPLIFDFDLRNLAEPPSGFDIFCKELFLKPDNRALRPRVIDAKWRALSRPKRRRYDDRARILQLQWIRLKQKSQALDYSSVAVQSQSQSQSQSQDTVVTTVQSKKAKGSSSSQSEKEKAASVEKRKRLLAEERQRRIEDMIAQNPNIYDLEERQKKEEHKKKTEKLLKMNKRKKKKIKSKKSKKSKNTVSLSDLNDIADQWVNEKPLRSPSIRSLSVTPHKSNSSNFFQNQSQTHTHTHTHTHTQNMSQNINPSLNSAILPSQQVPCEDIPQPILHPPTSKLQEWVSLAKQPKFKASSVSSTSRHTPVSAPALVPATAPPPKQQKIAQPQTPAQSLPLPLPSPLPSQSQSKAQVIGTGTVIGTEVLSTWDKLKESIICGDRIFIEIPCSSKSSPYILVSTASILQEWSDRLEDFHRWCTQYGECRFLPISQQSHTSNSNSRAVILEFSFVNNAKIAREKLEKKLDSKISFVQWRFGHAYFFKHSYVKLNEEIMMTGKELKRMDQIFGNAYDKEKKKKKKKEMRSRMKMKMKMKMKMEMEMEMEMKLKVTVLRPWEAYPHLSLPIDYAESSLTESDSESAYMSMSDSSHSDSSVVHSLTESDSTDGSSHSSESSDENNSDRLMSEKEEIATTITNTSNNNNNNKIIYSERVLYIGDIVYMSLYPHVPFIIHKNIGNGIVEILKPDNTKECVEISCLQNALSFPSLHEDTKNENELRFRQSLLEDLSECQLDYLLVCME